MVENMTKLRMARKIHFYGIWLPFVVRNRIKESASGERFTGKNNVVVIIASYSARFNSSNYVTILGVGPIIALGAYYFSYILAYYRKKFKLKPFDILRYTSIMQIFYS